MTNAEKQKRHRDYKKKAIAWYEKATGFKIKEIMDLHKYVALPENSPLKRRNKNEIYSRKIITRVNQSRTNTKLSPDCTTIHKGCNRIHRNPMG